MLSRVAERLYWFARYVERAENTARLINVSSHLSLDLPRSVKLGWQPIVQILGVGSGYEQAYDDFEEKNVIRFLVSDPANGSSIFSSLSSARENARTIRDVLPNEAWEQINELSLFVRKNAASGLAQRNRFQHLNSVILGTQQLTGLLAGTMTQDYGYDFLKIGRNLERADMTTRILDVRSESLISDSVEDLAVYEAVQWVGVLKTLSALQMYRRKVHTEVSRSEALNFLLREKQFPRAVLHCAEEVKSCVNHLPHNKLVLESMSALIEELAESEAQQLEQDELQRVMDDLQVYFAEVHQRIVENYFRHGYEEEIA